MASIQRAPQVVGTDTSTTRRPRCRSCRRSSRSSAAGPLHAQLRERSAVETLGAAALAATEVSRAVRERGVTAFDDSRSFVARDTTSTDEVRGGICQSVVESLATNTDWPWRLCARLCALLCASQVDADGLPLVYDRRRIQQFWDARPGELQVCGWAHQPRTAVTAPLCALPVTRL